MDCISGQPGGSPYISSLVREPDFQAFIDFTLVLCFDDSDAADFFGVVHMRSPVGLQVKSYNFYNTHLFDLRRKQVNLGTNQVGYGKRLLARQGIDANRVVCLHRFVDCLLNVGDALFVQILHGKIHSCSIWLHLPTCHLYSELFPDCATKDVQSSVGAHHTVTEVPVNSSGNLGSHHWRGTIKRVPDNIIALVKSDDIGQGLLVIPGDDTLVGHLPTPAWIEHSGVKGNLVTHDCYNLRTTFIGIAILMIEQFCLHKVLAPLQKHNTHKKFLSSIVGTRGTPARSVFVCYDIGCTNVSEYAILLVSCQANFALNFLEKLYERSTNILWSKCRLCPRTI